MTTIAKLPNSLTPRVRIPNILDERAINIYLLETELRQAQAETDAEIDRISRRIKWAM